MNGIGLIFQKESRRRVNSKEEGNNSTNTQKWKLKEFWKRR